MVYKQLLLVSKELQSFKSKLIKATATSQQVLISNKLHLYFLKYFFYWTYFNVASQDLGSQETDFFGATTLYHLLMFVNSDMEYCASAQA